MVLTLVNENGERGEKGERSVENAESDVQKKLLCISKIVHHVINKQHHRKGGEDQLVLLRMIPFQKA